MLAALNAQIGGDKIKFTAVKLEPVSSTDQERTLHFTANGALIGDLFVRRETAATLREKHPDSLDRLETLANELATPAGARLVELAQTGDLPADPLALVLLDQSAKAGTAFSVTGQILAARGNEGWKLEIVPGELTPALPLGKPRAHHPENALVASDPAFATTLERLVSARLALAEKLEAAREQLAEQLRHEREARQTALTVALQPGVLFLGQAEPLAGGEPIAGLVLEIATVKTGARQLTALLRNDGGWTDARTFTGSWETDDEFNALALPLSTRASHALADAGPLLSLREGWTIELSLAPDGTLAGLSPSHRYTFQRVASSDLERVRTDLAATHEAAVAATHVGTVYRGTVTPRGGGTETAALLRFTRQENNGARLEAELELVDQPGRSRAFRGFVAANRHRTGDAPIRLASEARRRAPRADPASVTGFAMDLAPALALKGDTLAGADDSFTYTFARLSDEEFGRIAATRRDAQTELLAAVKRGAAYDGTARHRDGFSTPVRLRFTRAEDDGTTEAVLESLKRPGVNVRLVGTADFTTRQLQFSSTGGRPDNGKDLRLPCFVQNAKYSLRLALGERTLDGAFEHDTEWTLAFTLAGGAVAAPAEFPAWPKAAGAYALIGDNWRPLPTNNGRSVNSANARLAKVTSRKDDPTAPTKVAELVFDGKDPVPAIPQGAPVALLYVGLVPPIPAATIAQYPDALRDYPAMELAPCRKALVGGKRIADLFRVTPEIAGFQTARTAATLSEPGTDLTLLLANVALPPGNYALLANGAAYEVQVK